MQKDSEHTDRPEGEGGSKLHSLKAWNAAVIFTDKWPGFAPTPRFSIN